MMALLMTGVGPVSSTVTSSQLAVHANIGPGGGMLTRVAGPDRVSTSIAASKAGFDANQSAVALVLARDDGFADALAGGPFAAQFHGPLLLTPSTGLTPELLTEIQRVLPRGHTIYILGGSGAISSDVDPQLQSLAFNPVRISGVDRYDTAIKIAQVLGDPPTVFEVDGTHFPDGLSAGPGAVFAHGAVLLTAGGTAAPETAAYLATHPPETSYAVGGPAAAADPKAQPLVGSDRYATSVAVARQFFAAPSVIGVASGAVFPDALSGGPVAGGAGGPMVLVPSDGPLPSAVQLYFNLVSGSVLSAWLFGGTAAVSTAVSNETAQALVLVPPSF
jgi:hypothetical protein